MTEDVWSASNTTPDAIDDALRKILHDRHAEDEALAPARVLNLVVIVDREWKGEISNRLAQVGRYTASRTILCAVEEGRTKLDAWAAMSYDEVGTGTRVMHETIEIDLGPAHLKGIETIIDPVVVSELPIVMWSPHGHDDVVDALIDMIDVLLVDSDDVLEPREALARALHLLESAYVVDLAWLRTTPWRERLAASFDPLPRRAMLAHLDGIAIRHRPTSRATALLLAGWLSSRLHWEPEGFESRPQGFESRPRNGLVGTARRGDGRVTVDLDAVDMNVQGLAGVTVSCGERYALSLDRGPGGLHARQDLGGETQEWQVLGASRGEGGILGEGVRQALLRDPTYGPALHAAQTFCGA